MGSTSLSAAKGKYHLNGQPVRNWALGDVIGFLPQQWDLFDMSLADNLRLADPQASDGMLWEMLDSLALGTWARDLPHGLDTPMGEYGAAVSGGQARRIALARVMLARRPILILDEPLAGLDEATRSTVVQCLVTYQSEGLLIIASHVPVKAADARGGQEGGRRESVEKVQQLILDKDGMALSLVP
ncbi:ATP-binding cassette domain-containing protein [Vreelandella azerica]|uniref:ATP-binding cassette domain-containing protein n=1 Tax=Vreelandella azerica TaxID=2732867 RepID=UPI002E2B10A1|nr:ATP-binding cassette domain-containing protein [Halomonas azerica]